MRFLAPLLFLYAICSVATAQSGPRLEFEVASVKLSPAQEPYTTLDRGGPESTTPGSWSCEYCSLRDLLSKAFALDDSQISGPAGMQNRRFHVDARLAPATTREQFREMLRNLLIDRFALQAHVESRLATRYGLAIANRGPKLRKSVEHLPTKGTAAASSRLALDADGFPILGPPSGEPEIVTIHGRTSMYFPNTTLKDLAEELSTPACEVFPKMKSLYRLLILVASVTLTCAQTSDPMHPRSNSTGYWSRRISSPRRPCWIPTRQRSYLPPNCNSSGKPSVSKRENSSRPGRCKWRHSGKRRPWWWSAGSRRWHSICGSRSMAPAGSPEGIYPWHTSLGRPQSQRFLA